MLQNATVDDFGIYGLLDNTAKKMSNHVDNWEYTTAITMQQTIQLYKNYSANLNWVISVCLETLLKYAKNK
jgi:hypothetical protein